MMKPTEAAVMENWWPTTTDCVIRKGFTNWSTGLPGTVETLMAYNGPTGTRQLFAVTSTGALYNVTTQGAVGAPLVTGLSNGRWQYVAIASPVGSFLLACNGADFMLRYNGTNWVRIFNVGTGATISTLTGNGTIATVTTSTAHNLLTGNTITVTGASVAGFNLSNVTVTVTGTNTFTYPCTATPSATGASYTVQETITGIDPRNVSNINIFKSRVWLVQKNSLSMWYLATAAIQGAATEYPLQALFPSGGFLQAMGTWTIDAGVGVDDTAVFVSSEGEILNYKGTDPASATTFALIGLYKIGVPIGQRCLIKYQGDLYVITDQGAIALSKAIITAGITPAAALTDKIQPEVAKAVLNGRSLFGWQLQVFAPQSMLLVNVPSATGNYQFAQNVLTGAWTKFTGWNASCFESQSNQLYFGGVGVVGLAWNTDLDNASVIVADVLPAFNSFGRDSQLKKFNLVRPALSTYGSPSVLISMVYEYDTQTQATGVLPLVSSGVGMTWGSMVWGSMVWGGILVTNRRWQWASGLGYAASMRMRIQNNGTETRWAGVDYLFEPAGVV